MFLESAYNIDLCTFEMRGTLNNLLINTFINNAHEL